MKENQSEDRKMTDSEIFIYGDASNMVLHLIRCFQDPTEEGDHIHTCIKVPEIIPLIENFNEIEIGHRCKIESIGYPVNFHKDSEESFELNGAIFRGGWIVSFCSFRITILAMRTIGQILIENCKSQTGDPSLDMQFFEKRTGPIFINDSDYWLFDKP